MLLRICIELILDIPCQDLRELPCFVELGVWGPEESDDRVLSERDADADNLLRQFFDVLLHEIAAVRVVDVVHRRWFAERE